AAEEMDALKDSGHELDGLTRVTARVSRNPRDVVSVRMGAEELSEIVAAAGAVEQNVSEFIRKAALRRAREVRADIAHTRQILAEYLPDRYREDMTDEQVQTLLDEVRSALSQAFPFPDSLPRDRNRKAAS